MTHRLYVVPLLLGSLQGCSSGTPANEAPTNQAPAFTRAAQSGELETPRDEAPPALPGPDVPPVSPQPPSRSYDLPPENASDTPDSDSMRFPDEVTDFMVTRDGCDHFRGEEPYDAERRAYIEDNVRQLCSGTDARLADLRRRYRSDAEVIAALRSYEDQIETPPQ